MFENLTAREKKLAMIVGALAPLLLVAWIGFWFIGKVQANQSNISGLMTDVDTEQQKAEFGRLAKKRQTYYREISLPSRVDNARTVYSNWLKNLVKDEIKMQYSGLRPQDDGDIKYNGRRIGKKLTFSFKPTATYPQLIRFLHEFYSAEHLHRINTLNIKPITKKDRNRKTVLTGELSLDIEIEVACLTDAEKRFESFPKNYQELDKTIATYEKSIIGRNIFGPANNAPSLEFQKRSSYLPAFIGSDGKETSDSNDITLTLRGDDLDKDNLLQFEILESESDIKGMVLGEQPDDPRKRSTTLKVPGQKEGSYKIKARVFDDGYPSKSTEESITVIFKKPTIRVKTTKAKVPFEFAKETYIVGHLRSEQWEIMIHVRPKNRYETLRAGDELDLDDKKWIVKLIDEEKVIFHVGDELLTYATDGVLGKPDKRESISKNKDKAVKDPTDDSASKGELQRDPESSVAAKTKIDVADDTKKETVELKVALDEQESLEAKPSKDDVEK